MPVAPLAEDKPQGFARRNVKVLTSNSRATSVHGNRCRWRSNTGIGSAWPGRCWATMAARTECGRHYFEFYLKLTKTSVLSFAAL